MEINKVGDLIPYKQSLMELWDKVEFLPVRLLCKAWWEESIQEMRALELKMPEPELRAAVSVIKTKLNFAGTLYDLPSVIQQAEQQIKDNEAKKIKFAASQESGGIQ